MTLSRRHLLLPVLLASLLTACGGGGSSSNNSQVAATASASGFDTTGYPGAPASVGNVADDGRNWINYRRGQLGLPPLTQNPLIDRAAQSHSDYQRVNETIDHNEKSGSPGFTGVDLKARLAAAGYKLNNDNFAVGEVISGTNNNSGFFMAEALITAIYHRFDIFEPVFKEIGTGSGTTARNYTYFTADFVANNGYGPGLGNGKFVVWPLNGQTAVTPNFFSNQETPDPVDNLDEVGYPVSVHADNGSFVAVSSFTIRPRNGADMPTKILQYLTDSKTNPSAAAMIPLTKLSAATVYDVAFSGTVNGIVVSRTWSFTTR